MTQAELEALAGRFPQLALPVADGESKTEEYRAAVLRGEPALRRPEFRDPDGMELESARTPAGSVEILYLPDRQDFEHAYRALAYRCENAQIPPAVGACIVDGLADWGRIRARQREYEATGGSDWSAEFKRFTAVKENYRTAFIVLSGGAYSAVSADAAGTDPNTWLQKSVAIRKYHELCHFVCRKLWPDKKEALRDEVYADFAGITAAFGAYDPRLARAFLGVEGETFREGGRLLSYAGGDIEAAAAKARELIGELEEKLSSVGNGPGGDIWETLAKAY